MVQLESAWEGDPPIVEAGVKLALLLLEQERDAEALKILERASDLAPDNLLASGAKGIALIRTGREQAGAELLNHALQQDVTEPLFYYEIARLNERSGAPDAALHYYRKGLELMLRDRTLRRGD